MTTRELLAIVEGRGLKIVLKNGEPVLRKPDGSDAVTDNLMAALKVHRQWIIEHLRVMDDANGQTGIRPALSIPAAGDGA